MLIKYKEKQIKLTLRYNIEIEFIIVLKSQIPHEDSNNQFKYIEFK